MRAGVLAHSLAAIVLCAAPITPASAEDGGAELFELDLSTLMTIQVGTSADASAKGLSAPYAGGQVADGGRLGILGAKSIMDTPFSTTSYTQEFTQNHQAASIGEVLQYDPSVQLARGFGNFQQVYRVRGFPIFSDDMTYNGLYGILPRQYLAAELIERVEVLRGANAFINGAPPGVSGALGGSIGAVPKRAPKQDLTRITLGTPSAHQRYAATDLARRSDDSRYGIRIGGVTPTSTARRANCNSSPWAQTFTATTCVSRPTWAIKTSNWTPARPVSPSPATCQFRMPLTPAIILASPGPTQTRRTCLAPCAPNTISPHNSPAGWR